MSDGCLELTSQVCRFLLGDRRSSTVHEQKENAQRSRYHRSQAQVVLAARFTRVRRRDISRQATVPYRLHWSGSWADFLDFGLYRCGMDWRMRHDARCLREYTPGHYRRGNNLTCCSKTDPPIKYADILAHYRLGRRYPVPHSRLSRDEPTTLRRLHTGA